ncbi:MAG: GNAT family N-acetyltransferase [Pseudomonadota bacterium]
MTLMTHPGAGWTLRDWARDDYARMEAIFRRCLTDFPWRQNAADELIRLRRTLAQQTALVATERQAGVIGFLTLDQGKAYVPHLFVDRDWRLCGVGSGLLKAARDRAGQPLQLDVDGENTMAQKAYAHMGWTVIAPAGGRRSDQVRMVSPD